jgi:hypothetical protein
VSAAVDWLVEPAEVEERGARRDEPDPRRDEPDPPRLEQRPVVAVVGLARRCGTTTVARALAAELAARDSGGAAAVTSAALAGGVPLGLPAAARLARTLAPVAAGRTRAAGRLCLVETNDCAALAGATLYLAPLVLDVHDPAAGPTAAAMADAVVVVGAPAVEPALATVVCESLARVGPRPLLVLNRGSAEGAWHGQAALELPDGRMAAGLAQAGREPRGELGRAVERLADMCCEGMGR